MTLSTTTLNSIVWAARALVALAFIAAGASKLAGVTPMVEVFEHIGVGQWSKTGA
jgi:putative oxidoreductase